MRHFGLAAAALLVLTPSMASAAGHPWQLAKATTVMAAVNSHTNTFVIDAYVTLPMSCYATSVQTHSVTSDLNRAFAVMQQQPSSMCTGPAYSCVASGTFRLPIQHTFNVYTKGKVWHVHLGTHPPTPTQPMCHKG
jgi:hypothetical protein